ncbi:efflux RND transporter periplasmic adaptor subunit [Vibrio natriegens]|uniref:efflux RND transporter periplasmic adaptor subunit n=1 Tax=Vibrio natriegens TaxID=691 RepID=UPI0021E891C3|nr:efflux RND transporter periplasmic adaptor subunit [Vibrio natriegens]UYI50039.1 efflux RND transporter periplasmic adaptor subunit [Vibrio natriegens]
MPFSVPSDKPVFSFFVKSVYFFFAALISDIGLATELPTVDCVITPHKVIDIASPVPGVLDNVFVERSENVSRGQIIAELASGVEKATVSLAKLRATVQSEIKAKQVNYAFEKRNKERIDSLYQKKAIPFYQADEAARALELSIWQLRQAKELSQIRKLELQQAEELLKQKTITSPIDGVVIQTFKSKGEYVEDQTILQIAQLNPVSVEAILPIEVYGQVKVGMQAEIIPEIPTSQSLKGKITIIDRIGDAASGTFGISLSLPNPDYSILTGLKCVLRFYDDSATTSVAILPTN